LISIEELENELWSDLNCDWLGVFFNFMSLSLIADNGLKFVVALKFDGLGGSKDCGDRECFSEHFD
jgi:hypothetical protein